MQLRSQIYTEMHNMEAEMGKILQLNYKNISVLPCILLILLLHLHLHLLWHHGSLSFTSVCLTTFAHSGLS